MHHVRVGFVPKIQRLCNIQKSINVIFCINRMNQNHIINSINTEKIFGKSQHQFMILNNPSTTGNVILHEGKMKSFPFRFKIRHVFSIILEVLIRSIKKKRKIQGIQIGKGEVKIPMFP